MLAECGIMENLAETLQHQSLDDFRDFEVFESLAHCGKRVNISPNFSRKKASISSIILEPEAPQSRPKESKTLRNKSTPLVNQKHFETSKNTELKLHSTLPELKKSKIKPKDYLDVEAKREMLSSSEEELSELYGTTKGCLLGNKNICYLMAPGRHFEAKLSDKVQSSGNVDCHSCQNQKDLYINRKRFKGQPRGKTKLIKKIKLSRPSLDLDKMQATRMRCDKGFVLNSGYFVG